MSDTPTQPEEPAPEPNLFSKPTEADAAMLAMMTPLAHQLFHSVQFLLQQRDDDVEITPQSIVYYGLTIMSLVSTKCQGIEPSELSALLDRVNEQCKQMSVEFAFPTPIGRA